MGGTFKRLENPLENDFFAPFHLVGSLAQSNGTKVQLARESKSMFIVQSLPCLPYVCYTEGLELQRGWSRSTWTRRTQHATIFHTHTHTGYRVQMGFGSGRRRIRFMYRKSSWFFLRDSCPFESRISFASRVELLPFVPLNGASGRVDLGRRIAQRKRFGVVAEMERLEVEDIADIFGQCGVRPDKGDVT